VDLHPQHPGGVKIVLAKALRRSLLRSRNGVLAF